jgi:hypothetical protein
MHFSSLQREEKCTHRFGVKPEGKIPLGGLGHRWEDNITIHLKETGLDGMNWIHLAHFVDKW